MIEASLLQIIKTFREISDYKQIFYFLLARVFYNDGLITIFSFGGIYAAGTFGFSFSEILIFGIVLNITAGIGAFIFGFTDDKLGSKITIQISNIGLLIAVILAVFSPSKFLFWIAGILVGIFSGPNQAASRSLMARFVPDDKKNEFYGFFAFSGKATTFAGPLLFGFFTDVFTSQRAGISVIILFFIAGIWILSTVNEKEGIVPHKR
jgi:UMF1 family MFS transporter